MVLLLNIFFQEIGASSTSHFLANLSTRDQLCPRFLSLHDFAVICLFPWLGCSVNLCGTIHGSNYSWGLSLKRFHNKACSTSGDRNMVNNPSLPTDAKSTPEITTFSEDTWDISVSRESESCRFFGIK